MDGNPVGTLRVEVTDNGAGIALEDRDRVFGELTQFNSDELRGGGELLSSLCACSDRFHSTEIV